MKTSKYKVTSAKGFSLKNYATEPDNPMEKKDLKERIQIDIEEIKKVQELFFADSRYTMLMIFQAMDAGGKDGAIRHVMSGINPQGCDVRAFKAPTSKELSHDYLWRHHQAMPERGIIGIHNRSHYEFVLTCKVNPAFVLKERIPGIESVDKLNKAFWKQRYEQIVNFEKRQAESGMVILKFFLHISKDEQKMRLLERIDIPAKNWKFDASDLKSRAKWNQYAQAYEEAIAATATSFAPWYIIPADDKWYARALIARILKEQLQSLDIRYPEMDPDSLELLRQARLTLMSEE
jgi:PPK2 family polyphosphate:nucleotide phosphotransferase